MSENSPENSNPYQNNDLPESEVVLAEEETLRSWGPWWSLLWTFVVICVWQLSQVVILAVISLTQSGTEGLSEEGITRTVEGMMGNGDLLGIVSFLSALIGCVMILVIVKVRGVTLAEGLSLRRPRKWWMWLLVFPAWLMGMLLINVLVSPFQSDKAVGDQAQIAGMVQGTHYLFLLLLGVSVGAPFFEEFLFRGLLHEGLRQSFLGPIGSGILTAAAFSAMHAQYQDPAAFLTLFLLGVLFTLVRELTGSLWLAIVMHAIQNTVVTGVMFLALNGLIPEDQIPEDLKEILKSKETAIEVVE